MMDKMCVCWEEREDCTIERKEEKSENSNSTGALKREKARECRM